MEVVPREAQAGLLAAVTSFLFNEFRNAAEDEVHDAARRIVQHARTQTQAAGRAIIQQVQRVAENAGESIVTQGQDIIDGLSNLLEEWIPNDPEIDELIQAANEEAARIFEQTQEDSLTNSQPTTLDELVPTEMQVDNQGNAQEVQRQSTAQARSSGASAGPVGAGHVSKETPISPAQPSYGLQETHTTILPFNFWFSVAAPNYDGTHKMAIRTNSIQDVVLTELDTAAADATWVPGKLYNVPLNNSTDGKRTESVTTVSPYEFPRTLATTNTTEQCWWTRYWAQLYEYYTVLGMEYEITIRNIQTNANCKGALIAIDHDSYSDTNGTTGNVTPDATLAEFMSFRHVKWHTVGGLANNAWARTSPAQKIIRGTVRPGQARRNISNDGDVKTWTKLVLTGTAELPNLKEIMNIRFFRDPLQGGDAMGTDNLINDETQLNVQVKLKYLVQFKDLREAARYPYTTNATTITQSLPGDALDSIGA